MNWIFQSVRTNNYVENTWIHSVELMLMPSVIAAYKSAVSYIFKNRLLLAIVRLKSGESIIARLIANSYFIYTYVHLLTHTGGLLYNIKFEMFVKIVIISLFLQSFGLLTLFLFNYEVTNKYYRIYCVINIILH